MLPLSFALCVCVGVWWGRRGMGQAGWGGHDSNFLILRRVPHKHVPAAQVASHELVEECVEVQCHLRLLGDECVVSVWGLRLLLYLRPPHPPTPGTY